MQLIFITHLAFWDSKELILFFLEVSVCKQMWKLVIKHCVNQVSLENYKTVFQEIPFSSESSALSLAYYAYLLSPILYTKLVCIHTSLVPTPLQSCWVILSRMPLTNHLIYTISKWWLWDMSPSVPVVHLLNVNLPAPSNELTKIYPTQ